MADDAIVDDANEGQMSNRRIARKTKPLADLGRNICLFRARNDFSDELDTLARKIFLEAIERRKSSCNLRRAYDCASPPQSRNEAAAFEKIKSAAYSDSANGKAMSELLLSGQQRIWTECRNFPFQLICDVGIAGKSFVLAQNLPLGPIAAIRKSGAVELSKLHRLSGHAYSIPNSSLAESWDCPHPIGRLEPARLARSKTH